MKELSSFLFVYGTLLKGEERSAYLRDCRLISVIDVPGSLYDTGMGYPAAVFGKASGGTVSGELYYMPYPDAKLKELDEVESIDSGFYERVYLLHKGTGFHSYQAGPGLKYRIQQQYRIDSGSWRERSSIAESDPVEFCLNFEKIHRYIYKEKAISSSSGLIYLKGDIPVLVTAPHSTAHMRLGKLKRQEFYTGALAAMLHNSARCHAMYTNALSDIDPNYYDESQFKQRLAEILTESDIKLLIDLHGTGPGREADIFPGIGVEREFLLGNGSVMNALKSASENYGIVIGGEDVFPAARQMTVTKYAARKHGVPSIQLEIVRELRKPDSSPKDFLRLTKFLNEFITQASSSI